MTQPFPKAVLFDLLTALLDSWSLWNAVAGSEENGRAWRAQYLRLTYGCGSYEPYEKLVADAARHTGLPDTCAGELEARWTELAPWSGAREALAALRPRTKLVVVTNCSIRLGRLAAQQFDIAWDAVITAEQAGYYKPDPTPYRMALQQVGVDARDAAFVAGSGFDLIGTAAVGLRTYWHNRIGLTRPPQAPEAALESRTLTQLIPWLEGRDP